MLPSRLRRAGLAQRRIRFDRKYGGRLVYRVWASCNFGFSHFSFLFDMYNCAIPYMSGNPNTNKSLERHHTVRAYPPIQTDHFLVMVAVMRPEGSATGQNTSAPPSTPRPLSSPKAERLTGLWLALVFFSSFHLVPTPAASGRDLLTYNACSGSCTKSP